MIDPNAERQKEEYRVVSLCTKILQNARTELYMSMHYLDLSLSSLHFEADESLGQQEGNKEGLTARSGIAVDGACIYYHPDYIRYLYRTSRIPVNRAYLHMVLHCLFGHLWNYGSREPFRWNLACDIAAEAILDDLVIQAVHLSPKAPKREVYQRLKKNGLKAFSAEAVYETLKEWPEALIAKIQAVFVVDNHCLWYEADQKQMMERQNQWKDNREKMQTAMESGTKEQSDGENRLQDAVKAENRERYDYRKFLRKFSVLKEEHGVDPDSFDMSYYMYGLSLYENLPLIEPLETREVFKVEDFVIVIDTSMSTSGDLCRRFLEETYDVLSEAGTYFRKVNIHIIQCDEAVRSDVTISNREEMASYMEQFVLNGGGGTDFRPAFSYVAGLIQEGKFRNLKGLLYFTDGKGIYPLSRPPYDVAFVFIEDAYEDISVPPWAIKLILLKEDIREE